MMTQTLWDMLLNRRKIINVSLVPATHTTTKLIDYFRTTACQQSVCILFMHFHDSVPPTWLSSAVLICFKQPVLWPEWAHFLACGISSGWCEVFLLDIRHVLNKWWKRLHHYNALLKPLINECFHVEFSGKMEVLLTSSDRWSSLWSKTACDQKLINIKYVHVSKTLHHCHGGGIVFTLNILLKICAATGCRTSLISGVITNVLT